jgi:hypothetical protein
MNPPQQLLMVGEKVMCGSRGGCCNRTELWFDVDIQVAALFFRPRLLSELPTAPKQSWQGLWQPLVGSGRPVKGPHAALYIACCVIALGRAIAIAQLCIQRQRTQPRQTESPCTAAPPPCDSGIAKVSDLVLPRDFQPPHCWVN